MNRAPTSVVYVDYVFVCVSDSVLDYQTVSFFSCCSFFVVHVQYSSFVFRQKISNECRYVQGCSCRETFPLNGLAGSSPVVTTKVGPSLINPGRSFGGMVGTKVRPPPFDMTMAINLNIHTFPPRPPAKAMAVYFHHDRLVRKLRGGRGANCFQ